MLVISVDCETNGERSKGSTSRNNDDAGTRSSITKSQVKSPAVRYRTSQRSESDIDLSELNSGLKSI